MKDIPVFKLKVDDESSGVDFIALVDHPAIERNWQAFTKERSNFKLADESKKIITGALMISDLPIYRRDERMGEYYALFDAETIYTIAQRYFKNKFTSNVNLMHDPSAKVDGVYMFESYIIDRNRGIKPPKGFEGITDGSWFGTFKVDNESVWDEFITTGELKGFSVEGTFLHEPYQKKELTEIEQIVKIIESIQP